LRHTFLKSGGKDSGILVLMIFQIKSENFDYQFGIFVKDYNKLYA